MPIHTQLRCNGTVHRAPAQGRNFNLSHRSDYGHGVLTPRDELALSESQRVREGIEQMKFFSREPLPSRDELHGRP